ncbi:MAG: glycosyltransferase family 1 protein [Parcubacteria group bacterium]|jgi:glycosyltransferase involved in cell wall biosynthesis
MIKIGINASFARKSGSGIGQVTNNFLKELVVSTALFQTTQDKAVEFVLYLEEDLPRGIKLPANFRKNIFLPFWKRDDLVRKILWEKIYLPRKAKADGCDVFLSLYQCPTIMPNEIFHIMLVHDIVPKLFPQYLNNARKRRYWSWTEKAISMAQKILAVSSRTEKDLIQYLGMEARKISVNYIDCDALYKKPIAQVKIQEVLKKNHLKPGYIYTGGGLEMRKNTENVLRAYEKLLGINKRDPFMEQLPKLVISGKLLPQLAPLVLDVEKLAKELHLSGHVVILDYVAQDDLPALYSQASFFIYPSHYEGFGLPVLEAMAVGCPVVTAKTSSLPEVGLDSVLYCHAEDVRDITMVMKNVLINPELRKTLRKRGQERAQAFSWKKFTHKIAGEIMEYKQTKK